MEKLATAMMLMVMMIAVGGNVVGVGSEEG